MVDLYLLIDKVILIFSWFGEVLGIFLVVIGVDGVLFGKDNEVILWFVSFLNLGNWIVSCDDNFFLLGVNCKEDYLVMIKYVI